LITQDVINFLNEETLEDDGKHDLVYYSDNYFIVVDTIDPTDYKLIKVDEYAHIMVTYLSKLFNVKPKYYNEKIVKINGNDNKILKNETIIQRSIDETPSSTPMPTKIVKIAKQPVKEKVDPKVEVEVEVYSDRVEDKMVEDLENLTKLSADLNKTIEQTENRLKESNDVDDDVKLKLEETLSLLRKQSPMLEESIADINIKIGIHRSLKDSEKKEKKKLETLSIIESNEKLLERIAKQIGKLEAPVAVVKEEVKQIEKTYASVTSETVPRSWSAMLDEEEAEN